jgi:hypothetical protein
MGYVEYAYIIFGFSCVLVPMIYWLAKTGKRQKPGWSDRKQ